MALPAAPPQGSLTLIPRLFPFLLTLLLICGVAAAQETRPASQPAVPQRIVSCAPNLTEMLFALGAGDRVVGVTRYCAFPPEAREKPSVGDLFNPDLETMVAARPDMVVVPPSADRVADFFRDRAGATVVESTNSDTLPEIEESLRILARALGEEARAEELIAGQRAGLDRLRQQNTGKAPRRVLFVVGREPGSLANLYAVGGGTYLDDLLEAAGLENVLGTEHGKWPNLTREAILRLNPDLIIESHHEADTREARADIERAWKDLPPVKAVREDAIFILEDKHVMLPGVRLHEDAASIARLVEGGEAPAKENSAGDEPAE